jgi:hypothetical protein
MFNVMQRANAVLANGPTAEQVDVLTDELQDRLADQQYISNRLGDPLGAEIDEGEIEDEYAELLKEDDEDEAEAVPQGIRGRPAAAAL